MPQSRTKRWILTWAQNATPVHANFWRALQHYPGTLVVIAGRYRNPTSIWTQEDRDHEWYADEVVPHLHTDRSQICPNLACYADVHIVPTAERPLTGWNVFCGKNSAIFGHPRRALQVIPTASRMPRILATTGACTIANYTDSKAGKRGDAHHVIGALVLEVESDGTYHLRHVSADKSGRFYDLDTLYTPKGARPAPRADVLSLGDLHAHPDLEDPDVWRATQGLVELVRPRHITVDDVLSMQSRSHHIRTLRDRYTRRRAQVESEVTHVVQRLNEVAGWGAKVIVKRSNHDEHLERWLEECNPHRDPENAPYYYTLWARAFVYHRDHGRWPDLLALEAERIGICKNVRFLGRDEDLTINDVAHSFHGDVGPNGSRGSSAAFSRLGVKTTTGHSHTPGVTDGNYTAGVTAKLDHGYNHKPSSWLNAHVLQYADGKRALIVIVNGRFRGV